MRRQITKILNSNDVAEELFAGDGNGLIGGTDIELFHIKTALHATLPLLGSNLIIPEFSHISFYGVEKKSQPIFNLFWKLKKI